MDWVILAFAVTWANDTFAYFAGLSFGKHKLLPAVSPKKTWEGFAGGAVGSLVGGPRHAALAPRRPALAGRRAPAGRRRRGGGPLGRPHRVAAEAGLRREGLLTPHPGPRRPARPDRRAPLRRRPGSTSSCSSRSGAEASRPRRRARVPPAMRRVAILGSTGSIGVQALDVVAPLPRPLRGGRAGRRPERGAARRAGARLPPGHRGGGRRGGRRPRCGRQVPPGTEVLSGEAGVVALAVPPRRRLRAGRHLRRRRPAPPRRRPSRPARTSAWPTRSRWCWPASSIMRRARRAGRAILPVDSEHSAIHQSLRRPQPDRGAPPPPHRLGRPAARRAGRGAARR